MPTLTLQLEGNCNWEFCFGNENCALYGPVTENARGIFSFIILGTTRLDSMETGRFAEER